MFIVVAIIIAAVGIYLLSDTSSGNNSAQDDTQQVQQDDTDEGQQAGKDFDAAVITEQEGQAYSGNSDAAPVNGTGAILAYDYDYYTNRSGEETRKHFNPDIENYSGDFLQGHIDKVPSGIEYNLEITPVALGEKYDIVLSLTIPGEEEQSWNQEATVIEKDGEYFIKRLTTLGKAGGEQQ